MKKNAILMVCCMLVAGCANLQFAWSASYATDNLAADIARAKAAK